MAEETQKSSAPEASPPAEEVVVVEKPTAEKEPPPPVPEPEAPEKQTSASVEEAVEAEKSKAPAEDKIAQSVSFKEETNVVADLPDHQKKALGELKQLIQEALNKHEFTEPPPAKEEEKAEEVKPEAVAAAITEQPKEEEKPPSTEEVAKAEEKAEASTETVAEEPPKAETEVPPKAETEVAPAPAAAAVETKEEQKVPPPPEKAEPAAVVVAATVETVTATVVDDDGAKTVEAIEETIVAVSAPAAEPEAAPAEKKEGEAPVPPAPEEVFIWGIPLLGDDRSDVILLKFLRARDFKVKEAFAMIKNAVRWRKEFGIEGLLEEDLGNDLDKVVFMSGFDKEGHPVCYNVYGEFQSKELYQNTFSDEEKRTKFLRWRIQFLENSIRKLDFSPSGICTIVQVNDLRNSPGPGKRELRQATNQALHILQDNYPEFVAKQVFINVPWWYLVFNRMISPFLTQRTKSKFVFAGPSKSADALLRYIAPEQLPVQYGGLSREGEQEFSPADPATEITIKPASKHTVEFVVSETGLLVWEVRVLGWDVSYGAEFVPSAEDGYTVIVHKTRKITLADEPVIGDSFKIGEPGKVVLTIDNQSSKKKKLVYRSKTKPSSD
ncbi:patellin-3-like [Malania oleifera]|uniref:patellin-3-like n=1 Tax=Malania oleifera TaxID=397392 RepID=UPI0025ADC70C|nr:patellin-3-like [Malania oleifera]